LADPLRIALGWQAVWWFGAICVLAALGVYALIVADPPGSVEEPVAPPQRAREAFASRIRNPASWILALAFGTFAFCVLSYNTWAPTYLIETMDAEPAAANFLASLLFLAGIPGNVMGGWLLNHTADRYRLLSITFLVTGILFAGSFSVGNLKIVGPYISLLGFVANIIPTAVFTLAPETMVDTRFAALGLAIVFVGSSTGTLVGPPLLGRILSGGNWMMGSVCMVAVMGIGLIASLVAWRQNLQPGLERQAQRP
jgi:cyanate permease